MAKVKVGDNIYSLLNPGSVVLVSAGDGDGEAVFACTWNMPLRKDPPMVAFESSQGHFTYQFIRKTGEFAINIPEAKMVKEVLGCGKVSGHTGVDKFAKFELGRRQAEKIKAPLVEKAFANLECRVCQIVDLGASALVIGQVVAAVADDRHFQDGKLIFDNGLELLHHLGGDRFCVSDRVMLGE